MSLPSINIWDSIGKVTSGFTLLALVIVAALFAYRIQMAWSLRTLKNSKGDERIRIIKILSDAYEIDISGLSKTQQYSIVMEQLNQRKQRYLLQLLTFTICMISFSIIAIFSINKYGEEKKEIEKNVKNSSQNTYTNTNTPEPYEHSVKAIGEKVKIFVNDRLMILNNKNTEINPNKSKNSNINTSGTLYTHTTQNTEPQTLDEILEAIKITKDKKQLNTLKTKARIILQPEYNFGSVNIKTRGTIVVDSKYTFISYDYNNNILELNLNRSAYYTTGKFRNKINANIKAYLNKAYHLDKESDRDRSFFITCVEYDSGCVTFQPISGVCADYIKKEFPECLKIDPAAYYGIANGLLEIFNTNNKELNRLYATLKIEHDKINTSHH